MGWKTLKDHFRIGHIVQITDKGICIGSPYIHDLIIIGFDGAIKKANDGRVNDDLGRYMAEMFTDPQKLCEIVQSKDRFEVSIPVYTYHGGNIIEKQCEELGWPNVTHDGCMMYGNTYSADKSKVVKWAKANAACGIKWKQERIEQIKSDLSQLETDLKINQGELHRLEADYPLCR